MNTDALIIDHTSRGALDFTKYNILPVEGNFRPGYIHRLNRSRSATHALHLKVYNQLVSLHMCVHPPVQSTHTWIAISLLDQADKKKTVYLNVDNLVCRIVIAPKIIESQDFINVLNGLTLPLKGNPDRAYAGLDIPPPPSHRPPPLPLTFLEMANRIKEIKYAKSVTEQNLRDAQAFIEKYGDLLKGEIGERDYILISSERSRLPFNIEYHKDGSAFCRYHSNFDRGHFGEISRIVDLKRKLLLVKKKFVIHVDPSISAKAAWNEANEYRDLRGKGKWGHPDAYPTKPLSLDMIKQEIAASEGIDVALTVFHVAFYTKETLNAKGYVVRVHKAAIYILQMMGPVTVVASFTLQQTKLAARSLIQNVDRLHELGYVHNDVKGMNALYDIKDGIETKLIDLAFKTRLCEFYEYYSGTKKYWPLEHYLRGPEFTKAHSQRSCLPDDLTYREVNVAKDNFALGVTLLELFGYTQWHFINQAQFIALLESTPTLDISFIPAEFQPVVRGFLHPDLKLRMGTHEALRLLS